MKRLQHVIYWIYNSDHNNLLYPVPIEMCILQDEKWYNASALEFISTFNSLKPSIKFEYVIHSSVSSNSQL